MDKKILKSVSDYLHDMEYIDDAFIDIWYDFTNTTEKWEDIDLLPMSDFLSDYKDMLSKIFDMTGTHISSDDSYVCHWDYDTNSGDSAVGAFKKTVFVIDNEREPIDSLTYLGDDSETLIIDFYNYLIEKGEIDE